MKEHLGQRNHTKNPQQDARVARREREARIAHAPDLLDLPTHGMGEGKLTNRDKKI